MHALLGVARYEFAMGIRRWGVWIAMLLAALPIIGNLTGYHEHWAQYSVLTTAAALALVLNLLMPIVGGIAMADTLSRDAQLGVGELIRSTPLPRSARILGKYVGSVGAILVPVFVLSLVSAGTFVALGAPVEIVPAQAVAFLGVNVPAYLFVGAFSLACPAVMPLRVYQILFTGYWFWGNFLNPEAFPTLAGTLLTPNGVYAVTGIFAGSERLPWGTHTPLEAIANLAVLLACAAAALVALDRCVAIQEARA